MKFLKRLKCIVAAFIVFSVIGSLAGLLLILMTHDWTFAAFLLGVVIFMWALVTFLGCVYDNE